MNRREIALFCRLRTPVSSKSCRVARVCLTQVAALKISSWHPRRKGTMRPGEVSASPFVTRRDFTGCAHRSEVRCWPFQLPGAMHPASSVRELDESLSTHALFQQYVLPTYGRFPLCLARGRGSRVWDEDGKEYLDFGAGIAVCSLGHAHPRLTEALHRQARTSRPHVQPLLHPAAGVAGRSGSSSWSASRDGASFATAARRPTRRFTSWPAGSATMTAPGGRLRGDHVSRIRSTAARWRASPPPGRKRSARGSIR